MLYELDTLKTEPFPTKLSKLESSIVSKIIFIFDVLRGSGCSIAYSVILFYVRSETPDHVCGYFLCFGESMYHMTRF